MHTAAAAAAWAAWAVWICNRWDLRQAKVSTKPRGSHDPRGFLLCTRQGELFWSENPLHTRQGEVLAERQRRLLRGGGCRI
jgi:hypothetical protein